MTLLIVGSGVALLWVATAVVMFNETPGGAPLSAYAVREVLVTVPFAWVFAALGIAALVLGFLVIGFFCYGSTFLPSEGLAL